MNPREAKELDKDLLDCGFTMHQLIEVAGQSVALSILRIYSTSLTVLVCCGPGNNGADGLVAARYLKEFGFKVSVLCPKTNHMDLLMQCLSFGVNQVSEFAACDLLVDALFGFGFHGILKSPYDKIFNEMLKHDCVISVDVPTGWPVDLSLQPKMLVSLSAPKKLKFEGIHFVGGRFIPQSIKDKYSIDIPYANDLIVRIN